MNKPASLILLILLCLSCDKQMIFEEFVPIEKETWNSYNVLHFHANISDTASAFDILISVRNSGSYAFSNLYLFVTTHAPNGNTLRDTVEITLADERGKWLGKGAASLYTYYHPFRQNIRFPLRGIYTFDIEQAMWIKELEHIHNIGLRIEKSDVHP
jgi:gliding motility-associated lipoprotein GldH